MEKEAGDMNVLKERLSAHFDRIKRLRDENDSLSAESAAATARAEELKLDRAAKAEELAAARSLVDEYRKKYQSVVEKISKGETDAETNKRTLLEAMDKLADIKANMSRLVAERNALSVSIEETSRRIEQISAQLEADKAELDKVCATLIENAERKTALGEKLQALYLRNNELNALATDTTDKIDKLNEKFYTAQSRRKDA